MRKILILLCYLSASFAAENESKAFDYAYASYVYANSGDLRIYELGARIDLLFKPLKRTNTYLQWSFANWSGIDNDDHINVISMAPVLRYNVQVYNTMAQPYVDLSIGFAYFSKKDFGEYNLSSAIRMQDSITLGFMFGENKEYDLGISYSYYNRVGFSNNDQEINAVPRVVFGCKF